MHKSGEAIKTAKLDWNKVEYIREHPEISNKEYAEMYGCSPSTINDVKKFRTWKIKNDLNS